MEHVFSMLAIRGVPCVRWFLFVDGHAGIRTDTTSMPMGPDDHLFDDLDAAVQTADTFGIKLIWVLFDFHLGLPAQRRYGVKLRGRHRWITNKRQRSALITHTLVPLFKRYGRKKCVLGWDLMNEPEWITFGAGGWPFHHSVLPWEMRRFLVEMAHAVHQWTNQWVTVGLASTRGFPLVRDVGLDLFQTHWYDRVEKKSPLDCPVSQLGLDLPLLLGEYPTRNSKRSSTEIVEIARRNGYSGAFAWSVLGEDSASGLSPLKDGVPGTPPSLE